MRARRPGPEVTIFVGPTAAGSARANALLRGLRRRPPVRRRDVEQLVLRAARPGVIVIVDGVFHDTLAVGHAEIREALERRWDVWGLSSMGAIRAREMGALGLRGFGRVFDLFAREGDFQDDEVALLHEPSPPYRAASEPLVHLRAGLQHLVSEGVVSDAAARDVASALKARWYGERTIPAAIALLARHAPRERILRELGDFDRFRLKTIDLEDFLTERPWRSRLTSATIPRPTRGRTSARN
jgi:hypothetical protein